MATRDVGIRELRNHTSTVLRALDEGDAVYLTNRGVRVAEIRPIQRRRPIDALIEKAAALSPGDTGAFDELLTFKQDDLDAQSDKDAALWG